MKSRKSLKFFLIAVIVSVCNAESINKQSITGEVIYVNDNTVQIEVPNLNNTQIGDKVTLYHKTPSGHEMKVGEWKVATMKGNRIGATPVDMYMPPAVGMVSKIAISSKKLKIEVNRQDQHNAQSISKDKDTNVASQHYVDKAKQMGDDLYKNAKIYSNEKKKNLWNDVIRNIQKAISLGNAEAYWLLAMVYEDGYGDIQADLKKMIDNIIKSAEYGYVEAQYMLGEMYEDGDEVMKDKDQAIYWYKKAVAQGHKQAKRALDKLIINPVDIPAQLRGKEPLNYGFGKKDNLHDLLDIEK